MRSLRSSSSHQLSVPRHNLSFGSRAFRFSAPRVWNSLPVSIRKSQSLPTFRRHLKTFFFSVSLLHFICPPCLEYLCPRALILRRLWHYINHVLTYLLNYSNGSRHRLNGGDGCSTWRDCAIITMSMGRPRQHLSWQGHEERPTQHRSSATLSKAMHATAGRHGYKTNHVLLLELEGKVWPRGQQDWLRRTQNKVTRQRGYCHDPIHCGFSFWCRLHIARVSGFTYF